MTQGLYLLTISWQLEYLGNTQAQLDQRSQSFTLTGTFAPFDNPVNNNYQGAGAVVGSNLGTNNDQRPYCDSDWITIPCVSNFQVIRRSTTNQKRLQGFFPNSLTDKILLLEPTPRDWVGVLTDCVEECLTQFRLKQLALRPLMCL